jgi:predicted transcriptional regulator
METRAPTAAAAPRQEAPAAPAPREAMASRLSELSREASDIDREVRHLEVRRSDLIARKNRILMEAHRLIERMSDKYLSRRILYWITDSDEFSVEGLAEAFNVRERVAQEAYRDLLRAHLVPEYKIRRLR